MADPETRVADPAIAEAERSFAERLGQRLRWVRQQRKLSLRTVARMSGEEFRISVLGAYERGHRMISVTRLQRLAELYGVSVDHLLPESPEMPAEKTREPDEVTELERRSEDRSGDSRVTLDLRRLSGLDPTARDLLARYLGLIQLERQDEADYLISIRPEDMRAIACLVEATSGKAKARLKELAAEDA
ncbi:MAG TPA: helix-turn-helix domain-containing protein [Acidimicrobiales bacterium]|nr:helix-turn-helix domain-containing protein [Acidimicrobiales bacterium]